MKRPNRSEFMEERKFDGKIYKFVNEDAFRNAMRKWETYNKTKERHYH